MQAVVDACKRGALDARPCVIISNNAGSEALARAVREGIPAYHLSTRSYPDADALDGAILEALIRHEVGLVVLAGYMKRVGPRVLARFPGRIINIHPALLPRHGGAGMYGERVHHAVLAARERETGVTIHRVDAEYDRGTIITQCRVPVFEGDTAATLAARVLAEEHRLLVETLRRILACGIDSEASGGP